MSLSVWTVALAGAIHPASQVHSPKAAGHRACWPPIRPSCRERSPGLARFSHWRDTSAPLYSCALFAWALYVWTLYLRALFVARFSFSLTPPGAIHGDRQNLAIQVLPALQQTPVTYMERGLLHPHKLPLEYAAILGKGRGERMHCPGGLGIWQHQQRQGRRVPALHGERCTCSLPFLPLQRLPRFMRFASPLTVLLALLCEGERRALCPQAQEPAGKPRGTSSFFASVV